MKFVFDSTHATTKKNIIPIYNIFQCAYQTIWLLIRHTITIQNVPPTHFSQDISDKFRVEL